MVPTVGEKVVTLKLAETGASHLTPLKAPEDKQSICVFKDYLFEFVFDLAKGQLFVTKVVHIKIVLLLGRLVASSLSASSYEELDPHWLQGCNMESLW